MYSLWETVQQIGNLVVLGVFAKIIIENVRVSRTPEYKDAFRRAHGADRD